jgi:NifU-like protein
VGSVVRQGTGIGFGGGRMGWEYSEKTKQLFMDAVHGKPGTHMGEIQDPDGLGEHGSIACGDALRFTFRVRRHPTDPLQDVITDARYLTFGCTSAIASSEALCTLIEQGEFTPIGALKITNRDIVTYLDGLPNQKIHCSVMGAEALEAAVFNWAQKRGVALTALGVDMHAEEREEGRLVCECFGLTEPYLKRKIKELGLKTIAEITGAVKAGGACMSCHHKPGGLQDLLNEVWGVQPVTLKVVPTPPTPREPADPSRPSLSPYQFSKRVEQTLEEYVRPLLKRDGGDVEIVDIKDLVVYCRLVGACAGCGGAGMTMKLMVERTLKDMVDDRIRIIAV